jgi:predicted transcriptional regulator
MHDELLAVYEDSDSMAVLVALYHWNPRTLEQITTDIHGSQDIIRRKLSVLTQRGFVSLFDSHYEISGLGKLFMNSLGLTKEELNQRMGKKN